jgi:hypothetical protein
MQFIVGAASISISIVYIVYLWDSEEEKDRQHAARVTLLFPFIPVFATGWFLAQVFFRVVWLWRTAFPKKKEREK